MTQAIKVMKSIVTVAIIVLILLVLYSFFISQKNNTPFTFLGYKPLTVLSNSMVPIFKAGDVIIIREVNTEELKEGDIITFYSDEDHLVTHRIISIVEKVGEKNFYTKGDNNNTMDEGIATAKDIVGKEIFHIPMIGYLFQYAKGPLVFLLFVIIPLMGYFCISIFEKIKGRGKRSLSSTKN